MRTPIYFAAAALTAAPAFAASEVHDYSGFAEVSVSAGISVTISQAASFSVVAEAENDRALRDIEFRQSGDRLTLSRPKRWSGLALFRSRPDISVEITMPDLDALQISSGASVDVTGAVDGDIRVEVSSGALGELRSIIADDAHMDVSSGGLIRIFGECDTLHADASSGASFDADKFVCNEAWADASSGAAISVHATQSVHADASSGAAISVHGRPEDQSIDHSSGGSVRLH